MPLSASQSQMFMRMKQTLTVRSSNLVCMHRLRPGRWCNFPGFERRIVDVKSHRGMVSENRSK